jgi:hypothetical protein
MALPQRPDSGPTARPATGWSATDASSVQILPVTNAERELAAGHYHRAVGDGYHRVVLDLQKAYGLALPPQWTHRQFLSEFLRDDMGILTTLVARLYRLYEPVRYGTAADWTSEDPVPILRLIYTEPPMRELYRGNSRPSTSGRAAGGPTSHVPSRTVRTERASD